MINQLSPVPEIITGDDQRDTKLASMSPNGTLTTGNTPRETTPVDTVNPDLADNDSIVDLALTITPADQTPSVDAPSDQMPEQILDHTTVGIITDVPPLTLPDANNGEYASTTSDEGDSFVRTAAGFAIAMLPRLFAEPDPASPPEDDIAQSPANGTDTSNGTLDDGFAINAYNGRAGPLLPSISDAARAQKMLLSLDGEINYIRKSISQLGINTDYLPHYDPSNTNTQDVDFKQLLITLAEHRAALRKIPFKTPMLYFYISSEYGYRKHQKPARKPFTMVSTLPELGRKMCALPPPVRLSLPGERGLLARSCGLNMITVFLRSMHISPGSPSGW